MSIVVIDGTVRLWEMECGIRNAHLNGAYMVIAPRHQGRVLRSGSGVPMVEPQVSNSRVGLDHER